MRVKYATPQIMMRPSGTSLNGCIFITVLSVELILKEKALGVLLGIDFPEN